MPGPDRKQLARDVLTTFAAGDRDAMERLLADDFTFSSPLDVGLDRAGHFERCWPGAGRGQRFEFVRVVESGDEVIVTYEQERADGGRGRNHGGPHLRRRAPAARRGLLRVELD